MQQRGGLHLGCGVRVEPEVARHGAGELHHVLGVLTGVAVALEQGDGERRDCVAAMGVARSRGVGARHAHAPTALGARALQAPRRRGQQLGRGVGALELGHADRCPDRLERAHGRPLQIG